MPCHFVLEILCRSSSYTQHIYFTHFLCGQTTLRCCGLSFSSSHIHSFLFIWHTWTLVYVDLSWYNDNCITDPLFYHIPYRFNQSSPLHYCFSVLLLLQFHARTYYSKWEIHVPPQFLYAIQTNLTPLWTLSSIWTLKTNDFTFTPHKRHSSNFVRILL